MNHINRSRVALICLVGLAYIVTVPLARLAGLKVDTSGLVLPLIVLAICVVSAGYLCSRVGALKLRLFIETYFFSILLILPESLAVYSAAHLNMPWVDPQLSAIDRALGWDWSSVVAWVDGSAFMSSLLTSAYFSIGLQLLLLPIILGLAGKIARAYQIAVINGVMVFLSALVSIWYPAIGTYAFYKFDLDQLQNLNAYAATVFMDQLVSVHDDPDFVFSLAQLKGIVTFPSMHAAVAVLCAWAAWEVKLIRYPILVLNVLMGFAAATIANHYIADIIAGIGVAGLSISGVLLVVRGERRLFSYRRTYSPERQAGIDRKTVSQSA